MSTLFIYISNEKETMDLDYVNKVFFSKYCIKMSIVITFIGNVTQNVFVCRRQSTSIGQTVWISRFHH